MRINRWWIFTITLFVVALAIVTLILFQGDRFSSVFLQRRAPTIDYAQTYPAIGASGQERIELKGRVTGVRSNPVTFEVQAKNRTYDVVILDQTKWFCVQSTYQAPDGKTYSAEEIYIDLSRTENSAASVVPMSSVSYDRLSGKVVQATADKRDGVITAQTLAIYGCPW